MKIKKIFIIIMLLLFVFCGSSVASDKFVIAGADSDLTSSGLKTAVITPFGVTNSAIPSTKVNPLANVKPLLTIKDVEGYVALPNPNNDVKIVLPDYLLNLNRFLFDTNRLEDAVTAGYGNIPKESLKEITAKYKIIGELNKIIFSDNISISNVTNLRETLGSHKTKIAKNTAGLKRVNGYLNLPVQNFYFIPVIPSGKNANVEIGGMMTHCMMGGTLYATDEVNDYFMNCVFEPGEGLGTLLFKGVYIKGQAGIVMKQYHASMKSVLPEIAQYNNVFIKGTNNETKSYQEMMKGPFEMAEELTSVRLMLVPVK